VISLKAIALYLQDRKFRVDEDDDEDGDSKSIWLERLDESGEPTEDYIEVDDEMFQLLIENNQIEVGEQR
jgi:hypothetical protein